MSDTVKSRWNWPLGLSAIAPWRGRGADWRDALAGADLPVQARDLIGRVIRRTRLWPTEKVELTGELIAHFADGVAAEESVAGLIRNFGDELLAARLLTRSARRKRNPALRIFAAAWAAIHWTFRIVLAIFIPAGVFYIILAILAAIKVPTIKVDYAKTLNAEAMKIPPGQRAWPMYRDAAVHMQLSELLLQRILARPGEAGWSSAQGWLSDHATDLDLVRRASQKKVLGFICGPEGSINDPSLWPAGSVVHEYHPDFDPQIVSHIPLPDIGILSELAGCLTADANLAVSQNQSSRCAADLIAIFNMADHIQSQGSGSAIWVACNLRVYAVSHLEGILRDNRAFLDDHDLVALSHRIAGPQVAADFFRWPTPIDRLAFLDRLQRVYSDNGHGDGRFTAYGFTQFPILFHDYTDYDEIGRLENFAFLPFSLLITPSRRQEIALYNRLTSEESMNMRLPIRDANWKPWINTWRSIIRYSYLSTGVLMFGDMPRTQSNYEDYLGERDGAVVAMALERYRRVHANYPPTLAALVSDYLPTIPADRITGKPVKYRLKDGKPVVYSVGDDRKDDGGVSTKDGGGTFSLFAWFNATGASVEDAASSGYTGSRGDWLLCPDMFIDDYQKQGAAKFIPPGGPLYLTGG